MAVLVGRMSTKLESHMASIPAPGASPGFPEPCSTPQTLTTCKRPKLSLKTTSLSNAYGTISGSSVGTGVVHSEFTPTTTNTIANQWDLTIRPSPITRTDSPRLHNTRSQPASQPYTLPFGVKSILKNSPLANVSATVVVSPRDVKRKILFPKSKKVAFRHILEDFIENQKSKSSDSDSASTKTDTSDDDLAKGSDEATTDEASLLRQRSFSSPPQRKRKIQRDSGISLTEPNHDECDIGTSPNNVPEKPRSNRKRRCRRTTSNDDLVESPNSSSSTDSETAPLELNESSPDETLRTDSVSEIARCSKIVNFAIPQSIDITDSAQDASSLDDPCAKSKG